MIALLDKAADRMNWLFPTLPWTVKLSYRNRSRSIGTGPELFEMACRERAALVALARCDLSDFLDHYIAGRADLNGDFYRFVGCRSYIRDDGLWKVALKHQLRYTALRFFPSSVRRKLVAVSTHYDLPAEFVLSYLDKTTRAYSSAIWNDPDNIARLDDESLEQAQVRKHRIAAEALQIQPDDKFLDIGCGYGYMVRMAEKEFGCRSAIGITLSQSQIDNGFSPNMRRLHYIQIPPDGSYDKLHSVGMISHLDKAEIRRYYRHLYGLLKSGGTAWIKMISPPCSPAGLHNYNTVSGTFSQKYIFPDHYQFPIHFHIRHIEETGFQIRQVHFRYGHYAKTLRHWYRRFVENLPRTRRLITPEIERAWHLYLTYASTLDGPSGSIFKQFVLRKP
jgi:cyclopropane-fatty-acyl-phospholipid synthase